MRRNEKPLPSIEEVARWLAELHGGPVTSLVPLTGGFWSAAYAFRVGEEDFVLRLSGMDEGFRIDARAARLAGPALPVPEVLEIGRGLGAHYAISRRHYGRFIEDAPGHEGDAIGDAMASLLEALRRVPAALEDPVFWYDPKASAGVSWHSRLLTSLEDDPAAHVHGWRAKLAGDVRLDGLFRACEARIRELLPACPERRDLVHGDLLHQNVLVAEDDPARVTAVFSWKCSVRGDFLYDVAWCTFWSPWHPAIEVADLWSRTLAAPDLGGDDLADAPLRHHGYELQIAASHLAWCAWTGESDELASVARATETVLERGPLQALAPHASGG